MEAKFWSEAKQKYRRPNASPGGQISDPDLADENQEAPDFRRLLRLPDINPFLTRFVIYMRCFVGPSKMACYHLDVELKSLFV